MADSSLSAQRLRQNGVYLITGGFGKIGLCLAHYLARSVGARLILIGRSELPAKSSWDEQLSALGENSAIGRKILAVRALEAMGAEVLAFGADVADEVQMRAVDVLYQDGRHAYVRGAIEPDDVIVSGGLHRIVPGQGVRIGEQRVSHRSAAP